MDTKSKNLIFIVIGLIIIGSWYFYSPQIINFWNSLQRNTPAQIETAKNPSNSVRNCGVSLSAKLDVPSTYENNSVLSCLGESAMNCENAKGVLKDELFPTTFEIIKGAGPQSSCSFKLSYPTDSTMTDITGRRLAGQYVLCPVGAVKAVDNTNILNPQFIAPDKTNSSKYASQIYFYGTLGLFVENNLDQNKIQALGCSGEYIQSVLASYRTKQPQ